MEIGPSKEYEFEPVIIPAVEPQEAPPAEAPAEVPEPSEPVSPELEPAH